jgi:pilus assembly protein CpaB
MAVTVKSSKKKNTTSLLVGAVIFGVIAALLSVLYLKIKENAIRESLLARQDKLVSVVVAKGNLPKGTQISSANMAVRQLPSQYVYAAAVKPQEFGLVEGRYLEEQLNAGTPLLKTMVKKEFSNDFSDTIGEGRRAMTIQVDEINTISGFIRPGNYVDIFAKLEADTGGNAEPAIIPVLQRALVLATGKSAAGDFREKYIYAGQQNPFSYNTLTLDVSPKQAALLKTAEANGDLLALLRNRKDTGGATFSKVVATELFSNATTLAQKNAILAAAQSADSYCEIKKGDITIEDGNVVNKYGKRVDNLVAQQDGSIVTRDSRVVQNPDGSINPGFPMNRHGSMVTDPDVVAKNCVLMTKDGQVLSGRGLTVDKNGRLVTKDGKVISAGDIRVTKDGRLITADGTILEDSNVMLGKDGQKLTADDVTVNEDGFIITKDGKVMTADGKVLEGVTVGADGKVRTADGRVLKADDIVVNADGTVTTKDGTVLEGVSGRDDPEAVNAAKKLLAEGMRKTEDGFIVDKNGNVYTPDGKLLKGVRLGADGKVRTLDGQVLTPDNIVVNEDGSVTDASGNPIAGVTADTTSAKAKAMQALLKSQSIEAIGDSETYEFITGGKGGVAEVTEVPIRE